MTDIVERLNDSLSAGYDNLSAGYSELRREAAEEIVRLRAKITEMEKQEPVCVTTKAHLAAMENGAVRSIVGRDPAFAAIAANENDVPLFTRAGAKGE